MKTAYIIDKVSGEVKFSITSRDDIASMIDSDKEVAIFSDNFPVEDATIIANTSIDVSLLRKRQMDEEEKELSGIAIQTLPITKLRVGEVSAWVDSNVKSQIDILDVLKQLIILSLKK